MTKFIDIAGQRFGKLVAVERAQNRGTRTFWRFRCDCGESYAGDVAAVKQGLVNSCGCLRAVGPRTTHGLSASPEFRSWASAKGRCTNPRNAAWAGYGGRGITMHPKWLNDFAAFYADMGPRPPGTTLDRIDNERGYDPRNCRWATGVQQAGNKRTSVMVEVEGAAVHLAEFARRTGVGYTRLSGRMKEFGETAHEAVAAMIGGRA